MKLRALVVLGLLSMSAEVFAGGYDTPMLYTARHMGMGGAAQAYVDDPSALFHNPAGLMGTERLSIVADFSLLTGDIQASPGNPLSFGEAGTSITSERTIAPFFLLGVSGRITDWLTAGFAVYPVASAGAEFKFTDAFDGVTTDRTRLVFLELSPGVAFQIPSYPKLSFGIGYRVSIVQLERFQETVSPGVPDPLVDTGIDFDLSGISFGGVRVGLQWRAMDYLQVGLSYRHKTQTEVTGSGIVVASPFDHIRTEFTLPSRLALGLRSDIQDLGIALDIEYAFNSQNKQAPIFIGADRDTALPLANVFDWDNAITIRAGVEYRLLNDRLPVRAGYVWDQQTSSDVYSSAFGTPPGPTHIITLGAGWNTPTWAVDVAYAYRQGSATVSPEAFAQRETADGLGECQFCAYPGDYEITLHGIYLSFSYKLGGRADDEEPEPVTYESPEGDSDWTVEPEPVEPDAIEHTENVDDAPASEEPVTDEPATDETVDDGEVDESLLGPGEF